MKTVFKIIFVLAICAILIDQPAFAALPSSEILDLYDQNGIYYYNPSGNVDNCNSAATTLAGNNTTEKIWNYFIAHGFTDAQAAGIIGNAYAESSIQPNRASNDTYWGLFQWKGDRKAKLFEKLAAANLMQYTTRTYWAIGTDKLIPENDFNKLLEITLDFTMSEDSRHWKEEIKKQNTPEAAAEVFLTLFERAVNGTDEILYYQPFLGLKYQGAIKRRNYARKVFEEYSGKGTTVSGTESTAENGANLTIIGDSLTNNSLSAITTKFPKLKTEEINAVNNRSWDEAVKLASSTSNYKNNVIFAHNDPSLTEEQLQAAIKAIGSSRRIIFLSYYSKDNPELYKASNQLLTNYSKNYSNILLADWESKVKDSPETYFINDSTLTEAGQKLYADLLYETVNSDIKSNGCSVSSDFISLVKAYAWPEYHKPPYTNRMPAYAEAVSRSIAEGRYVGGSVNGVPGIDCGGFVTIIVQNSGIEPSYNDTKGGTDNQERWVKSHGWIMLNPDYNTPVDTSILQPGDVALSLGHTFIYVGEIPGFNSVIASASYTREMARAPMAGHESLLRSSRSVVRWFRHPKYASGLSPTYNVKQ